MKCYLCSYPCQPLKVEKFGLFHFCPQCQTYYRDRASFLSAENEKDRYLLHHNSISDLSYQQYFMHFIKHTLLPFLDFNQPLRALDFGSGPQPVLAEVMSLYFQQLMTCFDPYFAPNYDAFQNKYQVITLVEVAEHIANPLELFSQLSQLLDDQGILAISTRLWSDSLGKFEQWWYMHDPTHITFYSQKTFEYLAQKFNYNILLIKAPSFIVLQKQ